LIVRAELAGVKQEDLNVSISGDTLTIQGVRHPSESLTGGWYHRRERETGEFSRAIQLPATVDSDLAEARYAAGVLSVQVPLKEAAKPKGIPVTVEEG
jgi:HSP20 family protein